MRRLTPVLLVAALFLGACTTTKRQAPAPPADAAPAPASAPALSGSTVLPLDPNVRTGRLDNGLTYYIRRNAEPRARAELRLALNAGSVLEDASQRGLAHFLEHMLFNGTRRFPEQELVGFLERTGMRFGPDVNAYTSFDETVYMLTVPTDSADILVRAFDVLEDWAHAATLSDEEIDRERGVVIEEWRLRAQNASGRIQDQVLPVYLHDSPYRDRLPIGDTTIIKHADYETIRRFYRDWYRPGLMAVVAVGDFDPAAIEKLIRDRFAGLTNPTPSRPRPTHDVPGHAETIYRVVTDPEYPYTTVEVSYKRKAPSFTTVDDYRERLISGLFNNMLNSRFDEIARQADAPFVSAGVYRGGFVRPSEFYGLQAHVQDDSVRTGLAALVTEAARVRRHGFTATELERQKRETLRAIERAYNEREKTPSASFADEYVAHFLEQEPAPGIAYEHELAQQILPGITLDEVNRLAADLLSDSNRAVVVTMPRKEGLVPPTEADLAAVFARVQAKSIAPYVDDVSDLPLLADVPRPAAVTAKRALPDLGVTEITLANGVKVWMKPTDFKQDEVQFTASSPGGTSLVSDAEAFEASVVAALVSRSGVGPFTRTELEKLLAGKVVGVAPFIAELEEGLGGNASPQDLETLFQLIHLYFTAPRADSSALAAYQNQMRAFLTNRANNPASAFQDTLQAALYGHHPRRRVPTLAQVDTLNLARAFEIYRTRFADASDFTFTFVGNFDVDSLAALAQTYLGSLPGRRRAETWRDVAPDLPQGIVSKAVARGVGQQSQVALVFTGPFEYTRQNRHLVQSLGQVLQTRLRETLREDMGGVYGVGVGPRTEDQPRRQYSISIGFGTDPARVDELVAAVFAQIDSLQQHGPTADDVAKVKEQQRRERETALRTNGFWISVLDYYATHPGDDPTEVLRYNELVEALDADDLRDAARRYLDRGRYVQVVLYPEGFRP